jgi:membrane protein DedA with SNARE-associated domain
MKEIHRTRNHLFISIIIIALLLVVSFLLAQTISQNELAARLVADFSYVGVVILGVIAGINTFIPLPAATFVPVFVSAGLYLPFIIAALVLGTLIADFTSYILGHLSRDVIQRKHPRIFNYVNTLNQTHHGLILPLVFIYSALIPFPNEAIIIPLGMSGVRFSHLVAPLLLGNIVHQTLLAYGVTNIFSILF